MEADVAGVKYGAMLRGASPGAALPGPAEKITNIAKMPIPGIKIFRSVFIVDRRFRV